VVRADAGVVPSRSRTGPDCYVRAVGRDEQPARYDGVADWYDRELATSELGVSARRTAMRLLGPGPGRLLDLGCGGGSHAVAFSSLDWTVTGIDVSDEQLRLAHARGIDAVRADAARLPFASASFDAAVSMWTHTDLDDFAGALSESARVLRPGGAFVYLGVHPCFVGPHSRFVAGLGMPELHPGYRVEGRYDDAPGVSPQGLRAKVGAVHIPLGRFLQLFVDAGFRLERFEEPGQRPYPLMIACRWRR
jgi:SAM-dependent methyltransferase